MASAKSMTDIAYDLMSNKKRSVAFAKLWADVSKIFGASNDLIGKFYTDLTLDSRFVSLKDNKWDLTERRKFEETHIDLSEIELDDDEEEESEDEDNSMDIIKKDEDEY